MCFRDEANSVFVTYAIYHSLPDISRLALCCHSNETRALIANLPNSAQLEGTPTIPPTYIRVRAVVWECSEGQTDGLDQ